MTPPLVPMTPDKQRLADRVVRVAKVLARFQDRGAGKFENDPLYRWAEAERHEAFTAAIRAELLVYPKIREIIEPWLTSLRGGGYRDVLRRIRRGLDTKVRRQLPMELRPSAENAKMIALHSKGCGLREIASKLPDLGIKRMSHTAVGKRLAKCGSAKGKRQPVKKPKTTTL